jgi:hypothetical protein
MRVGTSYFVSRVAACQYYAAYEPNSEDAVVRKIAAGEIHIGKPPLQPGQRLSIIPGEGRYQIESCGGSTPAFAVVIYVTKRNAERIGRPANGWYVADEGLGAEVAHTVARSWRAKGFPARIHPEVSA